MQKYQVPQAEPTSCKAINKLASQLLVRHSPQTLQGIKHFDVIAYLEFHLVKEHETDYRVTDTLPAGTWAETRLNLVKVSEETYLNASAGQGHARFTIAHELGHVAQHKYLLMKKFQSSQHSTTESELFTRDQLEAFRDPEWQANEYAAALLMPLAGMTSLRQRYVERITYTGKVMEIFKVSSAAANSRVNKLIMRGKLKF